MLKSLDAPAEDLEGNKFKIKGVMRFGGIDLKNAKIQQRLTVTPGFRKGSVWDSPHALYAQNFVDGEADVVRYELVSIKKYPGDLVRLEFKDKECWPLKKSEEDKAKELAAFKDLVMKVNFHKKRLMEIMEDMLVNVFIQKNLNMMEKEEMIDFIMDDHWMYLKCKDKAYRV